MRALAVERAFRVVILLLVAAGVLKVSGSRERLQHALDKDIPLLKPLANQIGWDPENSKLVQHIVHAFALSSSTLQWIAVGLAGYALIEIIEAVGLWLMKRWGEYFAVIATSVFLPLEIYELTEKITALRLVALLVNIVAVIWLLWSKRLFGLNGGGAAYRQEHEAESLLSVEQAGAERNRLDRNGLRRLACNAAATACVRFSAPSLTRMASTWWPTVFGLMFSSAAISRLLRPAASRSKTWR